MEWLIGFMLFCVAIIFIFAILRWIFDVPGYFKKCADELENISNSLRSLVEVERASLEVERQRVALERAKLQQHND
jgi:hypothetical protein